MSDSKEVLCRYYLQGVCRNGASCKFSHNLSDAPSMVCKFYLQGNCSYGASCRYDHVRPEFSKRQQQQPQSHDRAPRAVRDPEPNSPAAEQALSLRFAGLSSPSAAGEPSSVWSSAASHARLNLPDSLDHLGISAVDDDGDAQGLWEQRQPQREAMDPADIPICSQFAAFGFCSKGDACPKIHGNLCEVCLKYILHPYRPAEAAEHTSTCLVRKERAEAHLRSAEVECCICLEKVLSKASVSERKFGLMACDHAFCLSCIRDWRTHYTGIDVETALRTCPVCRTPTHFITPSLVWPETKEEKDTIVEGYKKKLASIDCKHFDRGNGTCPFGTSCFYRHMLPDGTLDRPTLRHCGNADGEVRILQPVLLSHFMDVPGSRTSQLVRRR
uniref:E3 ubiquitin-protein ligase makorin n=1 Tax=Tetraselmis sp. GSL018 TaxID=582737 RepID=A0A061S6I4_9CHLO